MNPAPVQSPREIVERLSIERLSILVALTNGTTVKAIAAEMGLSPKTIEYHRALIYKATGTDNLASLTRFAFRAGLIKLPACPI